MKLINLFDFFYISAYLFYCQIAILGLLGDIRRMDSDDQYPGRLLQQAAIYNNVELLKDLLLGPEADNVNAQDPLGRTALYTSVTNNSFECGQLLLQAGGKHNFVMF
jgi:ankyrin repeat protein